MKIAGLNLYMGDEQKSAGDVLFDLKRKSENLWYHYKWAIIMGIAVLALIIYAVSQCAVRPKADANVAYIGGKEINDEEHRYLLNNLNEILGEDLTGDKKIYVDFTHFSYMTAEQAEDERAMGNPVDVQSFIVVQTQINLELIDGNIIVYFIDPNVYKQLKKMNDVNTFMTLEDSLGYTPEKCFDEFSIQLKDLYCWEYYAGIGSLPENTLVTVRERQMSDKNTKATDEKYEHNLLLFKRLVEFKKDDSEGVE